MRLARSVSLVVLSSIALALIPASAALALASDLDTTFGTGGKVTTSIGSNYDQANAVTIQTDGKIVVGGYTTGATEDMAIVRYNPNGTLDTTFGGGDGIFTLDPGGTYDQVNALTIDANGKIVAAGNGGSPLDTTVLRLNSNGTLDTSFGGGDGIATANIAAGGSAGFDHGYAVAIDDSGNILVGGDAQLASNRYAADVVRFTSTGSLDATFSGGSGYAEHDFGGDASSLGVGIDSSGNIVIGGFETDTPGGNDHFFVARFTDAGSLDTSFNGTGYRTTAIGTGWALAFSLALQADDKILLGGYSGDFGTPNAFTLARYTTGGSLDSTFGSGGIVTTTFPSQAAIGTALAVQADGKILLAGRVTSSTQYDFALARYTSAGALDSTFAPSGSPAGTVTTSFTSDIDWAYGMALQDDGKIVLAGGAGGQSTGDFAVARYLGSPTEAAVITAPTAKFQKATTFTVSWAQSLGTVTNFDVRVRHVVWNSSTYSGWTTFLSNTTSTSTSFTGTPGDDYCFDVAPAGFTNFSPQKCSSVPLDDRALAATGSWTRGTGTGFYKNTFTSTKTHGNSLSKTGVHAHAFALLVEKCPTCGSIQVLFNGVVEKTVSLHATSTLKKQLITVTFSVVKTGTVKVVDSGLSGKLVSIDGLGVSRV